MMPKPSKIIKKGFDPPGNNYIALGSRSKDQSATVPPPDTPKQETKPVESAPTPPSNQTAKPKLTTNNSSSNLTTLSNSSTQINTTSNPNQSPFHLDSKTIKDEITKLLEKEDTNEKLIKLIKSLVVNLKTPSSNGSGSANNLKSLPQQQQQQQQPDLNFLMALSYVGLKRPQLFLKQNSLVEFIVSNILFTSRNMLQDKSNVLKSKPLQPLRGPSSPQQNMLQIQPVICNILSYIYENETTWPEIFVKAYVDDSLGERSWVDSPLCKDFVDNIKTAFSTRSIPFSCENLSAQHVSSSSNSSNDVQTIKNSESDSVLEATGGLIDLSSKKNQVVPRYAAIRNEIEILLVDLIRNFMNANSKGQAIKRTIGQTSLGPTTTSVNLIDNKNFLKLLQNTCGFGEIRAIALSKLEIWLINPKLDAFAQDLLLAICVNCNQGDQIDKDIVSQIIKIKPKLKHQQHYSDCIRELIKLNGVNLETLIQFTVRNELQSQQQIVQQTQTQQTAKLTHNLSLLQIAFSTDSTKSSKIFAQTLVKILLQKNADDYTRSVKVILRDTVRNSRQDFDLIKFTNELECDSLIKEYFSVPNEYTQHNSDCVLFTLAGGLADFSQNTIRERYVNSISDLIALFILVTITPQIKEAYLRRSNETKEILTKYYMTMSQIQCDTVTWLQNIFKLYEINPSELIRCLFKILFMVDKPEQCYTVDNWPSETERGTFFRVVSEIPVLGETLHQVLMITQNLPENLYMLMLCVEENLLKTAALVHIKDVYTLKLTKMECFVETLFNICMYRYQNPPTLVVTVLYWRAWQILLLLSALDPKGFGKTAWEKYPTLRLLMEMIMTEDYNFPPQCSVTEEMSSDRYKSMETTSVQLEKMEILDFENMFEAKQGLGSKTEANSKLIGQVMKFDPMGPPRRPTTETIQNVRKLNSEYKLGQLLCKNRQPDYLLMLIKRQNSKLALPWLASLIESSTDCLEILPMQVICEFVWNLLSGTEEEIQLKKQINVDQLMNRIKSIFMSEDLTDSNTIQQITDTFDYFLCKLESDKPQIRYGSLKILNKLFQTTNCILDRIQIPPLPGQQSTPQHTQFDLNHLINSFKQLICYEIHLKPLLIKHFKRTIQVETNPSYLNIYLFFVFKELIDNYVQQNEIESSLQMELDQTDTEFFLKNESFKVQFNECAQDIANFFFNRDYFIISNKILIKNENFDEFFNMLIEFSILLLKINEIPSDSHLIAQKQPFNRSNLTENSYIILKTQNKFYYLHEKNFNLIMYFVCLSEKDSVNDRLTDILNKVDVLNTDFYGSLNETTKLKLLKLNIDFDSKLGVYLTEKLISSVQSDKLLELISSYYGLGIVSVFFILKSLEAMNASLIESQLSLLSETSRVVIVSYVRKLIKEKPEMNVGNFIEGLMRLKKETEGLKMKTFHERKLKPQTERMETRTTQNEIENIKLKIENYKNRVDRPRLDEEMKENDEFNESSIYLIKLINESNNQNLESNLNKHLILFKNENKRIQALSEAILSIENDCLKNKRCILDILLDFLCHFDPQIVNKQFDIEFKLLFELRHSSSMLTQSFLLSLFLHQSNWQKLYDCLDLIMREHGFFEKSKKDFSLNPTMVLDFMSSIIEVPELWKGTEIKILQKSEQDIILRLTETQMSYLIDFIIEEMFILHESTSQSDQIELTDNFKSNLDKRIDLLKHIFKNKKLKREHLFCKILERLDQQKRLLNKIFQSKQDDKFYLKSIFNKSKTNGLDESKDLNYSKNILFKIQTIFLYRLYLEENSLIYKISNSNRLFTNFYHQIDKPTQLDLKAHNLLNCFGEIEVNFSYNLTSSGVIGVAVTSNTGKQKPENQEIVMYAKKQEAFMVDANFVCVKLASSHPFIFLRQLPMMEGLLQGRVGYSFDEFKKRKFDKLFHYVIDLLNVLVPYVFHQKYLDLIESIISHYFDVFTSYCADNREFIGGLVIKFCEFLERFINNDIKLGYSLIIRKYAQFVAFLQKSYPDISSLKFLNSLQSIPFDSIETLKKSQTRNDLLELMPSSLKTVNNLNQKLNMPLWPTKQLEPFINKLSNRSNFEDVLSVLQELDTVSQRQPILLSQFASYLVNLIHDQNDSIRDLALSLIMRHLRLNPKDTINFYQSYIDCLNTQNSKVFNSAIKYFPDFNLLSSENSESLVKSALKGSQKHNVDISKQLSDSIRLLRLEKYVY